MVNVFKLVKVSFYGNRFNFYFWRESWKLFGVFFIGLGMLFEFGNLFRLYFVMIGRERDKILY